MRKLLFALACLCVLLASQARAQTTYPTSYSNGGNITSTNAACVPSACVGITLPGPTAAVITVGVTGTFSATLAVEESQDGGTTFTSAGTSLTSTGTTSYVIAGFTTFRVRASAFVSGNAGVNLQVSSAPSGGVTSGTTDPTGNACAANSLYVQTTSGNLYTCKAGVFAIVSGGGGTVTSVTGTSPIASSGGNTPAISCPTCTTSAAAITNNVLAKGSGGAQGLANSSVTDDGTKVATTEPFSATAITCGVLNTTSCVITGHGSTSGSATITWPAVAGTATNPITSSNVWLFPAGAQTTPSIQLGTANAGFYAGGSGVIDMVTGGSPNLELNGSKFAARNSVAIGWASGAPTGVNDTALSRDSAGVVDVGTGSVGSKAGSMNMTNMTATGAISGATFGTATNCASGASPAVCAAAAAGAVAVPAGTNPTLTINTTAVTANSRIFLTIDESATISATTCNTTLSTLIQPVVTARTAGTSFTIQIGAVIAGNPACVSYLVFN